MDPTVVTALIGAGTTVLGIILTAILTYRFTVKAERKRILLEREERKKQEEEAKKKIERGTWKDVAETIQALREAEREVTALPDLRWPQFTCLVPLAILIFLITIAILLWLEPEIGDVFKRILTEIQ